MKAFEHPGGLEEDRAHAEPGGKRVDARVAKGPRPQDHRDPLRLPPRPQPIDQALDLSLREDVCAHPEPPENQILLQQ